MMMIILIFSCCYDEIIAEGFSKAHRWMDRGGGGGGEEGEARGGGGGGGEWELTDKNKAEQKWQSEILN